MENDKQTEETLKNELLKYVLSLNENSVINYRRIVNLIKGYVGYLLNKEFILPEKFPQICIDVDSPGNFACYTYQNTISVSEEIFSYYDKIVRDIALLAHELRHFAQIKGTRRDRMKYSGVMDYSIFYDDLATAMATLSYDKKTSLIAKNKQEMKKFEALCKKYDYYFSRKYFLKQEEMDARQFSCNLLYDLFENVTISLTPTESIKLQKLQQDVLTQFDYEDEIINYSNANASISKKGLKKDVELLQKTILDELPNIYNLIKLDSSELFVYTLSNYYDPVQALSLSLEYAYNDELAHKLFTTFLEACRNSDLFNKYNQSMVSIYNLKKFKPNDYENALLDNFQNLKSIKKELIKSTKGVTVSKGEKTK